ncbi:MAG: hypothetical protein AAFP98_05855 [Pseudomonadota bacterium]
MRRISSIVGVMSIVLVGQAPTSADAQELRGPDLAVASNFGQGFLPDLMDQALAWGVTDFRDAVYWDRVEAPDGTFAFNAEETTYPDLLAEQGGRMSLTVNNGHPTYDDGATPVSPIAVAGFAYHAAETLRRFPAIEAIEVGNEFNSGNFVSGAVKEADLDGRAAAYVALLEAVATRAKAANPDVRIIGGGVHSVPTGYLKRLLDLGAAAHMDAIALHPYSTPVEHYAKQIAVMRRLPGLENMPVEITEFGTQSAQDAPGKLIRSHCQYGLAGATRLAWYALNVRGDGFVPLITPDGHVTDAGEAFRFAQSAMAGLPLRNTSPDPFTYACLYDSRTLVIWGMPRDLEVVNPDVTVFDATGAALSGTAFRLSETAPLILQAPDVLSVEDDILLGPQTTLADSYHGFTYPAAEESAAAPGGFLRKVQSGGTTVGFQTMPGQDRPGRPWTPWLGIPSNADVRALPRTLLPSGTAAAPVHILHRYTAPEEQTVTVDVTIAPSTRSADGVTFSVQQGETVLADWEGLGALQLTLPTITLAQNEALDLILGPGQTGAGDITDYRFTVRLAD